MFITDLHNHIVPNVDDGSDSFEMSLEMIRMLYNQGVRNIYCTSHDGYNMGNSIKNVVKYISCNADVEYAEEIFYLNARKYL